MDVLTSLFHHAACSLTLGHSILQCALLARGPIFLCSWGVLPRHSTPAPKPQLNPISSCPAPASPLLAPIPPLPASFCPHSSPSLPVPPAHC